MPKFSRTACGALLKYCAAPLPWPLTRYSLPLGAGQKALTNGSMPTFRLGTGPPHTLASAAIRHNRELAQRQALLKSFVVSKDKQLVLLDRASQRSAKLIPFKRRCARGLIEEVPGIEGAVAQILEAAAVPGVGSR